MSTNTSGHRGVSWHKAAHKWGASICVDGVHRHLGLFVTAEDASDAYLRAEALLRSNADAPDPATIRVDLLSTVRNLYEEHGIKAVSTPFLEKQQFGLYRQLLAAGLKQPTLLTELGVADEYAAWRDTARTYRGVTKPKWSWDRAVAVSKEIVEREGELRNVEEYRRSGLSSLVNAVFKSGKTWEDLRVAVGLPPSAKFWPSRNGMRWRSRPEACLSNFLYARDIQQRRGERYPAEYSRQSGRRWGQYDLHFLSSAGVWVDVEVWGDPLNKLSGGRYKKTRAFKEAFQAGRKTFLGLPYQDCLKGDIRLAAILEPFIGTIEPFVFDKSADHAIETSHWSDADELLETCRRIAATMPDGIFPPEDWLRKRGKYKNRPGNPENTLSERVNSMLGGTRNVRRLLGHGEASTIDWTDEKIIAAWREFKEKYGLTPSQCKGRMRLQSLSPEVAAEASKIYGAAQRRALLKAVRIGAPAREVRWTKDYALAQWREFTLRHGRTPSECMSKIQRRTLPRAVTDAATNIYGAARRFGVLEAARTMETTESDLLHSARVPNITMSVHSDC